MSSATPPAAAAKPAEPKKKKNVSLRAEATRFNNMPQANGFDKKDDRLSMGLAYQF